MLLPLAVLATVSAVSLDLKDEQSFKDATKAIAGGIIDYYDGKNYGGTVGVMSPPYYWWQSASAFSGLLTYGILTEDHQYDDLLYDSIMAQKGDNWDFITQNQTMVEGNDDQGYWAMFAMDLAERDFRAPPDGRTWASLAQSVFDQMVTRWDPECGGGLRWQIFDWNKGYKYKNTVSTGAMFNIAARLARYTNNQTYVDWSYKIYNWMTQVNFITEPTDNNVFHMYDGAGTESQCQEISHAEWSYNYGAFLSGMAYLHDVVEDNGLWSDRIKMNWERANQIFFTSDEVKAMIEPSCQPQGKCNNDQRSFRAPFSRFLGHVANFVPDYQDEIITHLRVNSYLAARSCSGGSDGKTCGQDWSHDGWDGVYGLGEEMAALEVILNAKALNLGKPTTNHVTDGQLHPPSGSGEAQPAEAAASSSSASSETSNAAESTTTEASSADPTTIETSESSTDDPSSSDSSETSSTAVSASAAPSTTAEPTPASPSGTQSAVTDTSFETPTSAAATESSEPSSNTQEASAEVPTQTSSISSPTPTLDASTGASQESSSDSSSGSPAATSAGSAPVAESTAAPEATSTNTPQAQPGTESTSSQTEVSPSTSGQPSSEGATFVSSSAGAISTGTEAPAASSRVLSSQQAPAEPTTGASPSGAPVEVSPTDSHVIPFTNAGSLSTPNGLLYVLFCALTYL